MAKVKQSKPDAKAAATEKANSANPSGAAGKADKPTKRKAAEKAQAEKTDNVPELLREVIKALGVIAARVESVRRTLWRIGEVRNYENKGDKSGADAQGTKQAMIKLLGELYYPQWENLVQDISSGRIDTAPEYAELRALPDWAAFRASFNADGGKPKAAGAGKPKAKGGKR